MIRLVALLVLLAVAAGCRLRVGEIVCVDSAELIGPKETQRECAPGAHVELRQVGGERPWLMVCTCPPVAQPDGGAR